ncbi:DUF5686 family protein [Pedobacter sp. SG908]|uniref:DUF5686 family protein n=1 Tax=Pedobacter sp. SG908 TaxID=2587135 RepID=UPI0014237F93|nr:DUF5686 family protein [Pedobacter sp. SG908]NII83230.1 hypothetical protein [Pedobacter sp. SG908]
MNKKIKQTGLLIIAVMLLILSAENTRAQQKQLSGIVIDKSTKEPIPYATINIVDEVNRGARCDSAGRFGIGFSGQVKSIRISAIGFRSEVRSISTPINLLTIELEPNNKMDEVTVKATRIKYRNRDNPAVELIQRVINAREKNNARVSPMYTQAVYDKLSMSLALKNDAVEKSRLLRKFSFLKNNMDTALLPGRTLVPVFLKEVSLKENYSNGKPVASKVVAMQENRIDQKFDEDGFDEFMDKIYSKPDLYDHDIQLGNRQILSPIAAEAPTFYKYFIIDTIKNTKPWQVQVLVSPRNKEDALATGLLFIDLDGKDAVQRAELKINEKANINWVDNVKFDILYQQYTDGRYYLSKSTMSLNLGVFKEGMNVFGMRTLMMSDFSYKHGDLPTSTVKANKRTLPQMNVPSFDALRPEKLSALEQTSFNNVDSLKNNAAFNRTMDIASLLFSGFINCGKVELGPLNSLYSFNSLEGSRFRIGGRTTDAFSRKIVFDAYAAYGTTDKRFKYKFGTTFSLTDHSIYTFPVRSLNIQYAFDTEIPGQQLSNVSDDNVLLSIRRGVNNKMWYKGKFSAEYLHEFENHLSFKIGVNRQTLTPMGSLNFDSPTQSYRSLTTSEVTGEVRWAPNETFFQGKRYRRIINNGYPIFSLKADIGFKGVFGSSYNYQRFTFNTSKRFFLSQLGYSDVQLEGGVTFCKVPYPLLNIHRANQSFMYQFSSYNLMNFMEFTSNKYVGINIQHQFNGFFLNKIPLLKKLQLREVVSFKVLKGFLDSSSDPSVHQDLFRFPAHNSNGQFSGRLGNAPYMEASIGLGNIFKVLRVDYVRRLNYLNNPNVSPWGIRAKLSFDF